MGGAGLTKPYLYCSGRHCDGYHPIDEGQEMIASTILPKVIDFYMKNPKGQKFGQIDEKNKKTGEQVQEEDVSAKLENNTHKTTKSKKNQKAAE